jgi:hypothetical protein
VREHTTGGALVLSTVEFDVVWRGLGLGPPPVVLQLASPGRTHTQRRHIEAQVWAALRERGLASGAGLAPLLALLAAPAPRVEVRAWGATTVRAAAVGRRDAGVLARRRADAVVVEPCGSVAGAAAGAVAGGCPGPGRAAAVRDAALTAALHRPSGAGLRADLVARGADPTEAGLVARMLRAVAGRAQITVAVPDHWQVVRRSPELLELLDGPAGRYLLTRSDGADGTRWASVAPVDDRRLRSRIVDLLDGEDDVSPGLRAASAAGPPQ